MGAKKKQQAKVRKTVVSTGKVKNNAKKFIKQLPKKQPAVVTGQRGANTTSGERRANPEDHPHLPGRGVGNTTAGVVMDADINILGKEPIPDVPQYTDIEALRKTNFRNIVARHAALSAQIKKLEEEKKDLAFELEMTMEAAEVSEVAVLGTKVNLVAPSVSYRLDRIALAKAGVTPEQLEAGQVKSERKGHVRVLPPGTKAEA